MTEPRHPHADAQRIATPVGIYQPAVTVGHQPIPVTFRPTSAAHLHEVGAWTAPSETSAWDNLLGPIQDEDAYFEYLRQERGLTEVLTTPAGRVLGIVELKPAETILRDQDRRQQVLVQGAYIMMIMACPESALPQDHAKRVGGAGTALMMRALILSFAQLHHPGSVFSDIANEGARQFNETLAQRYGGIEFPEPYRLRFRPEGAKTFMANVIREGCHGQDNE